MVNLNDTKKQRHGKIFRPFIKIGIAHSVITTLTGMWLHRIYPVCFRQYKHVLLTCQSTTITRFPGAITPVYL